MNTPNMIPDMVWLPIKDGDPRAYDLYKRHYSAPPKSRPRNSWDRRFSGPAKKSIRFMTADCKALIVWRKFIDKSGQDGVNCAIFRNESDLLSSELILKAETLAWQHWPGERLYTYVNARKIKSTNPGYCFQKAGWRKCGFSKSKGLAILEKYPPAPPPERA